MKEHRKIWILPADLRSVDILCSSVKTWFSKLNLEGEIFAVTLLLREALNNAIIHGCKSDNSLSVFCEIRIQDSRIRITVKDDGTGFDWRQRLNRCTEPTDTSGRGICIYKLYSDKVVFNRKGNSVSLIRRLTFQE
ncbi:MAG: ATP-binding protein [Syntrophobacterales bacterium]|nr:ATP-binding protein [Syntrophobacterales bacterium]